jgi:hypothetical protein
MLGGNLYLYIRILANTKAWEAVHVTGFHSPSDQRVNGLGWENSGPFTNKALTFLKIIHHSKKQATASSRTHKQGCPPARAAPCADAQPAE